MKNRSVVAVIILSLVTLGIYTLYWLVVTKRELNAKGANIPTSWLIIIPLVNIFWLYKYYEGAEQVTDKKVNSILMFVLHILVTSLISVAICQNEYNNLSDSPAVATSSEPVDVSEPTSITPAESFQPAQNITPQVQAPVSQTVAESSDPVVADSAPTSPEAVRTEDSPSVNEEVPPAANPTV